MRYDQFEGYSQPSNAPGTQVDKEAGLRARVNFVLQAMESCHNAASRLEDSVTGPHPRPLTGSGKSAGPLTPPSLSESLSALLDMTNDLRNRLDRLEAAI